jgi:8-oxo-dGTP pyrophosphatase MutT (NUDIX family)
MYKIYHNGIPVFLTDPSEAAQSGLQASKTVYIAAYNGKKKMIRQYLDMLDKSPHTEAVLLHAADLSGLWADFQSCFKVLEAAGGYVLNTAGELLVFFRRDSWDMPKGKIDPGETPQQAAVREVQEETGLVNLLLGGFLAHTYHTYETKGQRILKKTWWYRMTTPDTDLVPQTEEDIEQIQWVEPKTWLHGHPHVYPNILEVIRLGGARG